MIILYAPDGGDPQYLDASRLRASEIQVIERTADGRWSDIREAAAEGDIGAMRVIAYVVRKRTEPALRLGDFDPYEGELRSRLDDREARAWAEAIVKKFGHSPDEQAEAFDELRDIVAYPDKLDAVIADVTAPKDPAPASQPSPASASE